MTSSPPPRGGTGGSVPPRTGNSISPRSPSSISPRSAGSISRGTTSSVPPRATKSQPPPARPSQPAGSPLSGRPPRGSEPPRGTPLSRRSSVHALRQPAGGASDDADRAERRRQATVGLVTSVYRLVKACQLYDDANQTVQQAVPGATEAVAGYCAAFDVDQVRLLFTPDMVFVNRRILRAPRETYGLALQLGTLLDQAGVNELGLERSLSASTLLRVARLVVEAQRSPTAATELLSDKLAGATARRAPPPDDWAEERRESPVARVVKAYAAAVLVLKAFRARYQQGNPQGAHEVKRIAQKLVALSESYPELLVAAAATPLPDSDPLRAATSSAVLALSMGRRLTRDRSALTAITHAALLADVGELRLGDPTAIGRFAPSALIVLARMGRFQEGTLRHATMAYEALRQWPDPPAGSPPADNGMEDVPSEPTGPSVAAVLVRVARQFNQLRVPKPGTRPLGIDEALRQLDAMATGELEIAAVRLLVAGLGFFPEGTLVELTTGEVAMVTGTPAVALDFARPPVRVLTDEQHRVLTEPVETNLARPGKGQRARSIQRALLDGAVPS